ncbi:hypothetical protein B0H14DRAFT_2615376 [Mycena olivaceomarginata]|nr:hypothetical protein B0H14DRAFT_2615376 [Mycena olivaceomarginata]
MLSEEALGALLIARSAYIDQPEYGIPDFRNVIETHTPTVLSTPSLFDLLNDTDIAPQDVDREALEKSLFDQPDPYDLDETDRVNAAISADQPDAPPSVQRSSIHWAVADYVRLDSPVLAKLISAGKKGEPGAPEVVQAAQPSETVENEDWDVED